MMIIRKMLLALSLPVLVLSLVAGTGCNTDVNSKSTTQPGKAACKCCKMSHGAGCSCAKCQQAKTCATCGCKGCVCKPCTCEKGKCAPGCCKDCATCGKCDMSKGDCGCKAKATSQPACQKGGGR